MADHFAVNKFRTLKVVAGVKDLCRIDGVNGLSGAAVNDIYISELKIIIIYDTVHDVSIGNAVHLI